MNVDYSSPVFGSALGGLLPPTLGDSGHAVLQLSIGEERVLAGGMDVANGEEVRLRGLPVTGFMAYNVLNANAAPGVLANYSAAFSAPSHGQLRRRHFRLSRAS